MNAWPVTKKDLKLLVRDRRTIFVLVALILFIQTRPRGLFPQAGRAAEDK